MPILITNNNNIALFSIIKLDIKLLGSFINSIFQFFYYHTQFL